jgi:adenylate cyclase
MASLGAASAQKPQSAPPLAFLRGVGVRQVRIFCGVILFCYLLSHYINHALGNISLDALEYGLRFHAAFWQSAIGTLLLYPALFVHGSLGLWALYRRRYFRWKAAEITQLTLGLLIPLMLCTHLIGERLGVSLYGLHRSYAFALYNFWVARPDLGAMQATLMLVAWIHGCIGLYFWLRLRGFFRRLAPLLLGLAVLLPALGLLGFYQQGRAVRALAEESAWRADVLAPDAVGTAAERANLVRIRDGFLWFYAGAIIFVFAARGVRVLNERRRGVVRLSYPGRTVRVPRGLSVLEASYRHGVPHANVCGGKGRCSTCRIRIIGDRDGVPPPSPREAFVLDRIGAAADPAVRLACQLRPTTDISLVPLLPPQIGTTALRGRARMHPGEERYLVIMFVDMRGSTQMAADQLPFDTVFMVNRFLGAVAKAVTQSGGKVNQYLGDGLLALFGVDSGPQTASRQALRAAAAIAANIQDMNRELADTARAPVRFGIGINGGDVIIGDIGYGENVAYTALGDAVNVAARLQDMTKEFACQAVVSDEVCRLAGFTDGAMATAEIRVRGRAEPVAVRKFADADTLAPTAHAAAEETGRA